MLAGLQAFNAPGRGFESHQPPIAMAAVAQWTEQGTSRKSLSPHFILKVAFAERSYFVDLQRRMPVGVHGTSWNGRVATLSPSMTGFPLSPFLSPLFSCRGECRRDYIGSWVRILPAAINAAVAQMVEQISHHLLSPRFILQAT